LLSCGEKNHSFTLRARPEGNPRERDAHAGDRRAEPVAPAQGLHALGGLAGIAGALLTHTTSTVSLETLSFGRSADVLVILILGGAGRLYGGILGAVIYMVARDQFSGVNPQYWYFWIGLLLVAVVMFLPNGILGGLSAFHKKTQ
jgi:hypothetical protein